MSPHIYGVSQIQQAGLVHLYIHTQYVFFKRYSVRLTITVPTNTIIIIYYMPRPSLCCLMISDDIRTVADFPVCIIYAILVYFHYS